MFMLAYQTIGNPIMSVQDVRSALEKLNGQTNEQLCEQFREGNMVIPKLVLMVTLMELLGMKAVEFYVSSGGSCPGIFLTPRFWK